VDELDSYNEDRYFIRSAPSVIHRLPYQRRHATPPRRQERVKIVECTTFQLFPHSYPPLILDRIVYRRSLPKSTARNGCKSESRSRENMRVVFTPFKVQFGNGESGEVDGAP